MTAPRPTLRRFVLPAAAVAVAGGLSFALLEERLRERPAPKGTAPAARSTTRALFANPGEELPVPSREPDQAPAASVVPDADSADPGGPVLLVCDASGTPLPGAEVRFLDWSTVSAAQNHDYGGQSGAAGRDRKVAELGRPVPLAADATARLPAFADRSLVVGRCDGRFGRLALGADERESRRPLRLVLHVDRVLPVEVVGLDGRGVAGVPVELRARVAPIDVADVPEPRTFDVPLRRADLERALAGDR